MTPEEKAIELVDKFKPFVDTEMAGEAHFTFSIKQQVENSKQCAVIAVDEILNVLSRCPGEWCLKSYWSDVKEEIEKL